MLSRQSHALPVLGMILLGIGCAHALGKEKLFAAFSTTPSNVQVTFPTEPCGANALVEWTAPPKDIFVETYVVKCESLDDRIIDIVNGDTTSLEIGPLELNSTYICYVAARTKFYGTSKAASSDPFSTESACPSTPLNVEAVFPSENCGDSALVTWDASESGNVDTYIATCIGPGSPVTTEVSGSVTEAVVGPLATNGEEYTCSVVAVNDFGTSPAGTAEPFTTGICTSEPMNVTATYPVGGIITFAVGNETCNQNVNVTWMAPANGTADFYSVTCESSMDAFNATVDGNTFNAILGPLSPNMTYTCFVAGLNAFGIGPEGESNSFDTEPCPGNTTVFITLSIEAELDGYANATEFTEADKETLCENYLALVNLTTDDVDCEVVEVLSGSAIPITQIVASELFGKTIEELNTLLNPFSNETEAAIVDGLSQNATIVQIFTKLGESEGVENPSLASAVQNVEVMVEETAFCEFTTQIMWDAPANNGGASIAGYIVACMSEDVVNPVGVFTDELMADLNITKGGNYSCGVSAVNGAGANTATMSEIFTVVTCPGVPTNVSVDVDEPMVTRKLLTMGTEPTNLTITWVDGAEGSPEETYSCKCVNSGDSCTDEAVEEVTGILRGEQTATITDVLLQNYTCFVIANNTAAAPIGQCSEGFDVIIDEAIAVGIDDLIG